LETGEQHRVQQSSAEAVLKEPKMEAGHCIDGYEIKLNPGEAVIHVVGFVVNSTGDLDGSGMQHCARCGRLISDEGFAKWRPGRLLRETKMSAPNVTQWEYEII
jgi:hypothetical protein